MFVAERTSERGYLASFQSYVSPLLLAAVVAVMLGDVVTTGIGLALGLKEANPVIATVIAELGLPGLVMVKAATVVILVVLPAATRESRRTFRAGSTVYVVIGLVVVLSNLFAIVAAG